MITRVEYFKGDGPLQTQVFDLTRKKYKVFMAVGETTKPDSGEEILKKYKFFCLLNHNLL